MAIRQKGARYDNREQITDTNVKLALDDLASQIVAGFNQANITPQGTTPPPPQISLIEVSAADGIFSVRLVDNGAVSRGIEYFAEYDTDPGFLQPTVVSMHASRNWRQMLGNLSLYWCAYSQYQTGPASPRLILGGATPILVVGGGPAGPPLHASTGSGTAPSNGRTGGVGYGRVQNRRIPHGLRSTQ